MINKEILKSQLEAFGFPEVHIQDLLNGRAANTLIGKVKLNRKTGEVVIRSASTNQIKRTFNIMDSASW